MIVFTHKDSYGDVLAFTDNAEDRIFVSNNNNLDNEVVLEVEHVKKLRKALKRWLVDNGHKAGKDGWEADGGI